MGRCARHARAVSPRSRARPAARAGAGLVRRPRARPAVAPSGDHGLGRPGQRGHAAADPRGAGAAGLRRLAGPMARAGRAGRRRPRRGGADVGAARLPPAGAAAARGGDGLRPRVRRTGARRRRPRCERCRASATTPPRRWRRSPSAQRHVVLDTNVRRVHARVVGGVAFEPPGGTTAAERRAAAELLPERPEVAARWAVAVMELGALVCTARTPGCARCPVSPRVPLAPGRPAGLDRPTRRGQRYDGTDRQARGRLLAVLRDAAGRRPWRRVGRRLAGRRPARPRARRPGGRRPGRTPRPTTSYRLPGRVTPGDQSAVAGRLHGRAGPAARTWPRR